jgi:hypothetical protein
VGAERRSKDHGQRSGRYAAEPNDGGVPKAAVKAGELPKNFKVGDVADFIVTGLQGAWLVSKVERDLAFAENFRKTLFSTVLA